MPPEVEVAEVVEEVIEAAEVLADTAESPEAARLRQLESYVQYWRTEADNFKRERDAANAKRKNNWDSYVYAERERARIAEELRRTHDKVADLTAEVEFLRDLFRAKNVDFRSLQRQVRTLRGKCERYARLVASLEGKLDARERTLLLVVAANNMKRRRWWRRRG